VINDGRGGIYKEQLTDNAIGRLVDLLGRREDNLPARSDYQFSRFNLSARRSFPALLNHASKDFASAGTSFRIDDRLPIVRPQLACRGQTS
jgi:hypothetical protein